MPTEDELRARLSDAAARGNWRAEATIRFALADSVRKRGDLSQARDELRKAADLFRAGSAPKELSATLNNIGLVSVALNDFETARLSFDEAIDVSSRMGDFDAVRRTFGNFASAVSDAGDFEAARLLHQQALEIATKSNDRAGMARALSNLAWTDVRLGRDSAVEASEKAIELGTAVTDPRLLAAITHTHALVCLRERAYERCIDEAGWCRRTFAYMGDTDWVALAEATASLAAAARGEWSAGVASLSAAVASIHEAQLRRGVGQRSVGLAAVAAAAGETASAAALCDLASSLAQALGDEALRDAADAQRRQSSAATPRGAQILATCRAMFQPSAQPSQLHDVPWLQRRYGERPAAPSPVPYDGGLRVGPLTLLDLTDEGHGWSLFQDLTGLLKTNTNYDAEERVRSVIERNDPMLAKRLSYDTEADNVSIIAKTREDILGVAAWVLSAV